MLGRPDKQMNADEGPELAYERTRVAAERTLMAWVRTSVSLIGFGFSIPKFLGFLAAKESLKGAPGLSPNALGIVLVGLGTFGLTGGIVEHVRLLQRLRPSGGSRPVFSAALSTAIVVGLAGLLAFVNLLLW